MALILQDEGCWFRLCVLFSFSFFFPKFMRPSVDYRNILEPVQGAARSRIDLIVVFPLGMSPSREIFGTPIRLLFFCIRTRIERIPFSIVYGDECMSIIFAIIGSYLGIECIPSPHQLRMGAYLRPCPPLNIGLGRQHGSACSRTARFRYDVAPRAYEKREKKRELISEPQVTQTTYRR